MTTFVCGHDPAAKRAVTWLAGHAGLLAIDVGGIEYAGLLEAGADLLRRLIVSKGTPPLSTLGVTLAAS